MLALGIGLLAIAAALPTFQPNLTSNLHTPATCIKDSQCLDQYHCQEGNCHPCIPCKDFNREASSDSRNCARSQNGCGSCLKGFISEELSDMKHSFLCLAVQEEGRKNWIEENLTWFIVCIIVLAVVIFIGVFCLIRYFKNKEKSSEKKGIVGIPLLPTLDRGHSSSETAQSTSETAQSTPETAQSTSDVVGSAEENLTTRVIENSD